MGGCSSETKNDAPKYERQREYPRANRMKGKGRVPESPPARGSIIDTLLRLDDKDKGQ
jgi:hypothetical protein